MKINQFSEKSKKIIGIVCFAAFVVVVLFSVGLFGVTRLQSLDAVKNQIKEYLTTEKRTVVTSSIYEEESSIINVVERVSPSVVSIIVETLVYDIFSGPEFSEEGIGTGFAVDPAGIIVTNSHVVDSPNGEYSVVLSDGSNYEVTKVHLDRVSDLAILEINARDLQPVELGDSDEIKVGQKAIAIGNALGRYSNTVTVGVVSGIARELTASGGFGGSKTYEGAIQTDAALNPGNSGGPLLNTLGQVVGINVATTRGADNVGFAIPINKLKPLLETFLVEGRIIKPFLGVSYTIISREMSVLRNYPEGAYVSSVVPETPAQRAGLKRGDIVTRIDGAEINSDNSLGTVISESKVGDYIELEVDRGGKSLTFGVTLEEAPGN